MNEDELIREEQDFIDRRDFMANSFINIILLLTVIEVLKWAA